MANEERFTGLGEEYAQYRPSYPAQCVDWLVAAAQLNENTPVADVGAGTGILTRLFLQRGIPVTAVEPNADMRAQAEAALAGMAGYTSMAGSAEKTGLKTHSVKLVTAAQAFHWFDPGGFAAECRRILKPGGQVAIIFNTRDASAPVVRAHDRAFEAHCPDYHSYKRSRGETTPDKLAFFKGGRIVIQVFENPLEYSQEGYLGHVRSTSYFARLDAENQRLLLDELTESFHHYARDGVLHMPNCTEVYLGEV